MSDISVITSGGASRIELNRTAHGNRVTTEMVQALTQIPESVASEAKRVGRQAE